MLALVDADDFEDPADDLTVIFPDNLEDFAELEERNDLDSSLFWVSASVFSIMAADVECVLLITSTSLLCPLSEYYDFTVLLHPM